MKKSEIRTIYLEKRKILSLDEVNFLSEKIFKNFISRFNPTENQNVHIFMSIEKFREVNTKIFIDEFFAKNINVFVPRMKGDVLESVLLTPETQYKVNSWGIAEPSEASVSDIHYDYIIVPLLYCDRFGNRVGYGKGYYDRFFREIINKDAKKIGVSFFLPDEEIDDISDFDVPLDYLVTPDAVLSFGAL